MATKKSNIEKREEIEHKDLDGDGEKGESPAHKAKVLGKKPAGKPTPFGGKQALPFGKKPTVEMPGKRTPGVPAPKPSQKGKGGMK